MPKKITNPLREGLPSKIYLLAYGDHLSGYEIARKIYGIKGTSKAGRAQIPPTAKVYGWLKKLEKDEIVSIKKEGKRRSYITSNVDPLINEVERKLKDYKFELSDFEKHVLKKVLDSRAFREWVREIVEGLSFEHDVDAVKTIMSPVSSMALIVSMTFRKFSIERKLPETQQHFDKVWDQLTSRLLSEVERKGEKVHERLTEVVKTEKMVGVDLPKFSMRDAGRFMLFLVMPDSLLQKLAARSDPVDRAIVVTLEHVSELPKLFTAKSFPKALDKLVQTLEKEFEG